MTNFEGLLRRRRMIRRFSSAPVDPAALEAILDAATRAPSPHNRQPWRFVVLRGVARARLADAMGAGLIQDLAADGVDPAVAASDAARSRERITSAPVSILVCMTLADMDVYPDARRASAERWMAGQATSAAIQIMLLRATDLGLGACWMCAPLFCPDIVRVALELPRGWEPQALISLGHPVAQGRDRPRMPAGSLTIQRG